MIPFRTGNLGVERLRASRLGHAPPDPGRERAELAGWRALGFDAVEDYVFWELVEPQRGRFDWSFHRGNALAARRAGLRYVVYPWMHAAPAWFRSSQDFVPGRCLEHGQPGPMPSPFAASTAAACERLLAALAAGLGDVVDGVAAAFPADYGEAGFLSGVAGWLLGEGSHHHTGLWCDESEARHTFARQARDRHGTPGRLGAAWGLPGPQAWEHCPYPADLLRRDPRVEPTLQHRLDFARCYQGAITALTRRLLECLAARFPGQPRELKLGHCSETLELGTDWHALVEAAGATGTIVRFTGSGMGEVFTKRVASLCRTQGVPFATEGPREIPERFVIERAFTDLAAGTTSVFEYPEQMRMLAGPLEAVRPALGRAVVRPAVALFYPTLELALQPGHGAPAVVAHCFDAFRRVCDLELLDETQVARGALSGLAGLVWLEGGVVPAATLAALRGWIEAGGVLVAAGAQAPLVLDGDARSEAEPLLEELTPLAPARLGYRLERAPSVSEVLPGEAGTRLLLGPGWHGRENGTWAWPQDGRAPSGPLSASAAAELHAADALNLHLPCRWSGALAAVKLLRPAASARPLQLVIDCFVPPQAPPGPVHVYLDGEPLAECGGRGAQRWQPALPAGTGDVLTIELEAATHRPQAHGGGDARDLGLLVQRIALVAEGDAPAAPAVPQTTWAEALAGLRCDPRAARRLGRGWVLRGDGSPLSALAWVQTWLDAAVPDLPAPAVARDPSRQRLVTWLEGGRLDYDPLSQDCRWTPRPA